MQHSALQALIHGFVQGVGFRYYVCTQARRIGVVGTVKNMIDGTVMVWAEGSMMQLKQLEEIVRTGPSMARVSKVDIQYLSAVGTYRQFNII
jgi:acylphosphatase